MRVVLKRTVYSRLRPVFRVAYAFFAAVGFLATFFGLAAAGFLTVLAFFGAAVFAFFTLSTLGFLAAADLAAFGFLAPAAFGFLTPAALAIFFGDLALVADLAFTALGFLVADAFFA